MPLQGENSCEHRTIEKYRREAISGRIEKAVSGDEIIDESPLSLRVAFAGKNGRLEERLIASTLRTQESLERDREWCVGYLVNEGFVRSFDNIISLDLIDRGERTILARLSEVNIAILNKKLPAIMTSSCGICHTEDISNSLFPIDALLADKANSNHTSCGIIDSSTLLRLAEIAGQHQKLFPLTGGCHGAALFDCQGNILGLREDIGRHNALDKLLGALYQGTLEKDNLQMQSSLSEQDGNLVLWMSSRCGYELIKKCLRSPIKIACFVGSPSNLSISLASEFGITVIGFASSSRFNIYCGKERVRNTHE